MIPAVAKCFITTLVFIGNYAWPIQVVVRIFSHFFGNSE